MTRRPERPAVRWGVLALLVASGAGAVIVSLNSSMSDIPSFAFGSHVVLAVQVALVLFYGALLLLVPLVRALDGDLPVELSLRGARWTEEAFGIGDEVLARQKRAEEKAAKADLDIKKEVRLLREQLKDAGQAQDKLVSLAFERIAALENVGGRGAER